MKKVFIGMIIGLMLLTLTAWGTAAEQSVAESLTFTWEQLADDLSSLKGWALYMSPTPGAGYVKVVDIPYTPGTETSFSSDTVLNVSGAGGSTVNKYFVMVSVNTENFESPYSNEVAYGFKIPVPLTSAPFNLIMKVNAVPK